MGQRFAQFHPCHDLRGQHPQRVALQRGQLRGSPAQHAQGAQWQAVAGLQHGAGIEAKSLAARAKRVVDGARIVLRVGDFQNVVAQKRMGADGFRQRGLAPVDPGRGLEPLPVGIDEADQRDGHVADRARKMRNLVIFRFGIGIEDLVGPKRRKPGGVVGMLGGKRHHESLERRRQRAAGCGGVLWSRRGLTNRLSACRRRNNRREPVQEVSARKI